MARRGFTWSRSVASGANVTGVLQLRAEDQSAGQLISGVAPYIFDENGRISTSSHAGAAITIPDSYTLGEMWELRWTFAETGNSTRRGIFLEVRQGVANSATLSGMEVTARQSAAVAIGTLEGINGRANIASTSTGNISAAFGVTGEININSSAYTGTITYQAGVRSKVQVEDGSTLTAGNPVTPAGSYLFFGQQEGVSGPVVKMAAVLGASATNQSSESFDTIIDSRGVLTTVSNTDQSLLWKFLNSSGTAIYMRYDQSVGGLVFATS